MLAFLFVLLGFQIGMGVSEIGSRLEARRHPLRRLEDTIRLRPTWLPHLMVAAILLNVAAILSA